MAPILTSLKPTSCHAASICVQNRDEHILIIININIFILKNPLFFTMAKQNFVYQLKKDLCKTIFTFVKFAIYSAV